MRPELLRSTFQESKVSEGKPVQLQECKNHSKTNKTKTTLGQALVTLARPAVWAWSWQEGGRATSETELTRSRRSLILQLRESRPKEVKWFWSRSHSSQMTSLALSAGLWALAPCSSHHTNISSWLETVSMVRPSHQDPNHPVGKSHITGQLKE